MANESVLGSMLEFLDESLEQSTGSVDPNLSLNGDEWDANLLLEALDNDVGEVTSGQSDQTLTHGGTNPDQIPTQGRQVQKKKQNKNKARDERRFVLIQLRDEVEKLEFTLKQLQNMRNKPKRLENSSNDLNEDSGVPSVWREICERQLHRRLKAERENSQLKQELAREEELAKNIQKLLYKRRIPKETGPEAQKHTRRTDIPAGYIERMAAFIFDELAAGVDIMYRQMEGVYEAITSLPTVERPFLHGSVKGKDAKLLDRKVLDFNLHAVGDAWWQTWHNHRQRNVHESQDDTIVETFGLEMNDFNANISVSSFGQQILRRSVEEQRIMFIWNAYMEPFVFENERVSGIYFLEQCHVYIKPEEVDEGKFSTSMSTFYTITPYVLAPESPKDMKAVDFFVSSLFSTIKTRSEMVENLLLDQVLEKYNL